MNAEIELECGQRLSEIMAGDGRRAEYARKLWAEREGKGAREVLRLFYLRFPARPGEADRMEEAVYGRVVPCIRVKVRPSRAKVRPEAVRRPGCVAFPEPHQEYQTDGVEYYNRLGIDEMEVHVHKGVRYAKLYCKGGYDAATGQRAYKKYPLAEIFQKASKP